MNPNRTRTVPGFVCIILIAMNALGCSVFNEEARLLPELTMTVSHSEIAPGASFDVMLTVKNPSPSGEFLMITTSCQEFAGVFTYQDSSRIDFAGNNTGCARAIATYEIVPNSSVTFQWELNASVLSWNTETAETDTVLAAPGEYLIQIRLNITDVNGYGYQADSMERVLRVQ